MFPKNCPYRGEFWPPTNTWLGAENARPENDRQGKPRDWNLTDWKMTDETIAEFRGLE